MILCKAKRLGVTLFKTKLNPELISPSAWVAPNATVVGDVTLEEEVSIWFGSVLRGDVDRIYVGKRSNVQDLCCLHADPGVPCIVGAGVTIGHSAIVHGALVRDGALIGMRAVVLNGAVVGEESLIAAGTVIREGQHIPPRVLVAGVPGKIIRELTDADVERMRVGANHYVQASAAYRNQ
jgi:carbonic anhydrase/acetyltransferase-like protein (isoleucine patch superfamily)